MENTEVIRSLCTVLHKILEGFMTFAQQRVAVGEEAIILSGQEDLDIHMDETRDEIFSLVLR